MPLSFHLRDLRPFGSCGKVGVSFARSAALPFPIYRTSGVLGHTLGRLAYPALYTWAFGVLASYTWALGAHVDSGTFVR